MDPRVLTVVLYMERHLAEPLRVVELASLVSLSASRLTHLFRAHLGMPPQQFLRELRLDRARTLLEHTTMSVCDVRILVGCLDASHFARDYRARHGVGPRESRLSTRRKGNLMESERRTPMLKRHGDSRAIASEIARYDEDE